MKRSLEFLDVDKFAVKWFHQYRDGIDGNVSIRSFIFKKALNFAN